MRCAAVVMLLAVAPAPAETPLAIAGAAGLDRAALDALPAQESGALAGPSLWSVLEKSGAVTTDFHNRVRQVVVVTGQDGYTAVLALAEIDPEFENKPVLLALSRDGAKLALPRLAVPGDKRAGRSVRDVVRLEVR